MDLNGLPEFLKNPDARVCLYWRKAGKSGSGLDEWEMWAHCRVCQLPTILLNCVQYRIKPQLNGLSNFWVQFYLFCESAREDYVIERRGVEEIFQAYGFPECRKKLGKPRYDSAPVLEVML